MNLAFLEPAEAELIEAIAYYNQQSEGLGYEFAAEVERTLSRIVQFPLLGPDCPNEPVVAGPIASRTVSSIRCEARRSSS